MKGYVILSGYMGHIPNEGYMLFATEQEYLEYYAENYK